MRYRNSTMLKKTVISVLNYKFGREASRSLRKGGPSFGMAYFDNGEFVNNDRTMLSKASDIEAYAIQVISNYYRTLQKQSLTIDSKLSDHGLDSLDSIEIALIVEKDLGYEISSQTLPTLNKVKHFALYIEHVENLKRQINKFPLS